MYILEHNICVGLDYEKCFQVITIMNIYILNNVNVNINLLNFNRKSYQKSV